MMVDDATEEGIAASVWKIRSRCCTLHHTDIRESGFSCRLVNVGETFLVDLGRMDMPRGTDATRQSYRKRSVTCAQIGHSGSRLYLEPRGETLRLASRRAMNKRQIRQTADRDGAKGRERQQSKYSQPPQSESQARSRASPRSAMRSSASSMPTA